MNIFLVLVSLLSVSLTVYAEEDPWYKTAPGCVIDNGNPGRTNVYENVAGVDLSKPLRQQWKIGAVNTEHHMLCYNHALITVDGAFDFSNGKKLWDAQLPISALYSPYGAGQIYKDRQFVVAYSAEKGSVLYQIDPMTGKIVQTDLIKDPPDYHAKNVLLYNDVAYLYDLAGRVVAYDYGHHQVLWTYIAKNNKPAGDHMAIEDHYLAFNSAEGLTVLDTHTGQVVFQVKYFFGVGPAFAAKKVCAWGYNVVQCFDMSGKKIVNVKDDDITPLVTVMYPTHAFFQNVNLPNAVFEINFSSPKNDVSDYVYSNASSSFFGIDNMTYYYDYDHSKYCAYHENDQKLSCNDFHYDQAFVIPTLNGLVGVDNRNHIYFFNQEKR